MSGLFGGGDSTPTPEQQERAWRAKAASQLPPSGATNPVEGGRSRMRSTIMSNVSEADREMYSRNLGGTGPYTGLLPGLGYDLGTNKAFTARGYSRG